jgi:hypothetical protein
MLLCCWWLLLLPPVLVLLLPPLPMRHVQQASRGLSCAHASCGPVLRTCCHARAPRRRHHGTGTAW